MWIARPGSLLLLSLAACGGSPAAAPVDLGATDVAAPIDLLVPRDGPLVDDPYSRPGPSGTTTVTQTASLAGFELTLTTYVPTGTGPYPVVVLSPGFNQVAAAYVPYAERMASHEMVVVLRDDPGAFTATTGEADQLVALVADWLPAQNGKPMGPLAGRLDLAHVGLIGHSRGGQVSTLAATGDLHGKVAALFGLDPVDVAIGGRQARADLPSIGIPTAFLGETLDGQPVVPGGLACAPAADDYAVLYAAAPSPSLLLTALGADHYDFELASASIGSFACHSGSADSTAVLEMSIALATGFFARELRGAAVGPLLDEAGAAAYLALGLLARQAK